MPELTVSVAVAAPAERTWALVTDWALQGRWIPATAVTVTRGSGTAVGDRVVARTAVGPIGFDDPMEITRWDPPHRCDVVHLGRVVRGTGIFAVEDLGPARSRFTWAEQVEVPLGAVGLVGFRLLRPVFGLMLRVALRRLARMAATA